MSNTQLRQDRVDAPVFADGTNFAMGEMPDCGTSFFRRIDSTCAGGAAYRLSPVRTRCLVRDRIEGSLGAVTEWLRHSGTGCIQFIVYHGPDEAGAESLEPSLTRRMLDTAAMIAEIRSGLSLQVTEIAAVVGVERPTVYSWINGSSSPQKPNRERLRRLYEFARQWRKYSASPAGKAVREAVVNGQTLLDLLKEAVPDEDMILSVLRQIAKQRAEPKAKLSVRQIAAAHGFPTEPSQGHQDRIDLITGKRFDLE